MGKNKLQIDDKDDNKKNKRKFRGRHFLLTQNDVSKSPATIRYLKGLNNLRFLIGCREVAPKTNHIHDHFYTQFKDATTLSLAGCNNAHIDQPKGTTEECIGYIYKLKEPWKRGLVYVKVGEPHFFSNLKVKDVIDMNIEDIKELPVNVFPAVEKVKRKFAAITDISKIHKESTVYYIWGETYSLKSKYACLLIEKLKGRYCETLHASNGFINGMEGLLDVAFYDEFRDTDLELNEFLKLIDYNVQTTSIKGSYVKNRYKTIVITSSQDPTTLYKNREGYEKRGQWLRRMEIYHFWYDKDKQKYLHEREDYSFDVAFRPCKEITEAEGCGNKPKHMDGSLLNEEELEIYNMSYKKVDNPFIKINEMIEKETGVVKEDEKELPKELDGNKEDKKEDNKEEAPVQKVKRKAGKKLQFSKPELRLKVYNELKKPLDLLPKTDEELLQLITPPDDAEDDDDETNI